MALSAGTLTHVRLTKPVLLRCRPTGLSAEVALEAVRGRLVLAHSSNIAPRQPLEDGMELRDARAHAHLVRPISLSSLEAVRWRCTGGSAAGASAWLSNAAWLSTV